MAGSNVIYGTLKEFDELEWFAWGFIMWSSGVIGGDKIVYHVISPTEVEAQFNDTKERDAWIEAMKLVGL